MDVLIVSTLPNYNLIITTIKSNLTLSASRHTDVREFLENNGFKILEVIDFRNDIFYILDKHDPNLINDLALVCNKLNESEEQTEEGEN